MEALTNTNSPIMYDLRRFGREVMGIQPGVKIDPKSEEFKFISDQAKKFNDARMKALSAGPASEPRYMSLTNAEGRVIDVMIKPDGEPIVVNPQTLNTQQGMFTQVNPTNVAPIIDPRTGQQITGYAADPSMGGAPMPGIGGAGMAVTNAPTAAPTQTPTPSPTPYPEGAKIRKKSDGLLYQVVNGIPQLIPGQ